MFKDSRLWCIFRLIPPLNCDLLKYFFFLQFPLATYDTLFMYWPRNNVSENYVFLLGKNTKQGSDKSTSTVFVSSNYGNNFTKLNLTSTNTPSALIDQIYSGKVKPQLVRQIIVHST